jgi:non-heme chloroperoxidase
MFFSLSHNFMMAPIRVLALSLAIVSGGFCAADEIAPAANPAPLFVTVEENVKLEVVDWGGSGRPLVLLAGLGNNAHVFDKFAPKLTPQYHVYGITRRGFGASSVPASGYSSERLGEDVIAVLDELKIERPILAGHSVAGSELSYMGSVHPERIAALIYLDAAYEYAFYDEGAADARNLQIDANELREKLEQLPSSGPRIKQLVNELLTSVQQVEKELYYQQEFLKDMPEPPKGIAEKPQIAVPTPAQRILGGWRKYKSIPVPVLAIYAMPSNPKDFGPMPKAAFESIMASSAAQAEAFEKGVPSAHVVRIANASHFLFTSNEADVLREMKLFIEKLPPADIQPNQPPVPTTKAATPAANAPATPDKAAAHP